VSLKGPRNFVTAADRRAEEIVREELAKARPDYGFLGEEGGARPGTDTSHRWIVDPLDGTTNFLHGIPHFAVSIALERNGAIVAALTFNPANDELFVAEHGKGAFLNNRRIRVAARKRLAEAVVACGLPHFGRGDLALARCEIAAAQQHFAGLRRYGAATLDLAWIAAGRLDAYWERDLSPWDLAAGMLLVREAGGFITDLDGGDAVLTKGQVAAGNDTMHHELLRLLKEAGKEAEKEAEKEAAKEAAKLAETS
jgi:myo-inositol-1(or 4)-monophosphatase